MIHENNTLKESIMTKVFKLMAATSLLVSSMIAAEYTIKVTHVVSPNTPKGMAADFFAKRVGELSSGKVEVLYFQTLNCTVMARK